MQGDLQRERRLADLSFRIQRLVRGDTVGGGQPLLTLAQQDFRWLEGRCCRAA